MINKKTILVSIIAATLIVLSSSPRAALRADSLQLAGFTPIDVTSTQVVGINDMDVISGGYNDFAGTVRGFFLSGGKYTSVEVPDAVFTELGRGNSKGQFTGDYVAQDGIDRPFVRNADGSLILFPGFPGASATYAIEINAKGDLLGAYTLDPMGAKGFKGYILVGLNFQTFSYPGATVTNTYALGWNDAGTVVGSYTTTTANEEHGFIRTAAGAFTQIDVPNSKQTEVFGINNGGDIVGRFLDASGKNHGFLRRGTTFTTIDYAGPNTFAFGINNKGTIVGWSFDDPMNGPFIGFKK